ncbi:MAG: Recombinase [Parcubacteria group bacterium GW2011_GWC1_42_11]|uniref:Recombinase n=1 Tax=Candidatus Nomurabacteria bacterium GW2011_GWC2_42_20 TaxID=1618756 RepID=A0A0G1BMY5_9BACT|nr:MAG: Recombinase [Parcubacteria group bacterium GW2011_GWC1_42_11]KKS47606.1 MAG: Recombinase [Candidatus Nomurabacteria bacterium GW2011_GWC2_42_20]KKT09530.1 MAG: Recombinase [Candidatus Nomurabacteria bacterium GW2011_GWB1_43_20]
MAKVDIFNECTVFRKGYFKLKYKHMKSIIYCRVSSREQEETGYSLESQEKFLKEYADKQAFAIAKAYKVTESASKWQIRTTLKEMLEYAEENNINVILVEKIDRLTRSLKDAAIVNDWVHQRGEREVHFTKENFVLSKNTRSHENLVWDMKVAIARFYTNNLSEEVRKGQKEKIAQGWLPTKPPLGYKTVGEKGHKIHVVDEDKAPFIKKAFELYATGNFSLLSLREKLYTDGLRTRVGAKLSKSRLEDILRDPFYCGSMRWNDVVYQHGRHEPLVSKDLFEKVQYSLTRKSAPHYRRHLFQFSKMINCGECNGTVSAEMQKGYVYYSCKHARGCNQKGMTREEKIENAIIGVFKIFESMTEEEAQEIYRRIREDHKAEADYKESAIKTLNDRYSSLQRRLDILYDDRLAEKISQERWQGKQDEMVREQTEIQAQIAKIKREETKYFEVYINILDLARRAREIYEKRTPEEKRLLISHLFSNLVLKDKEASYLLKKPVELFAKRVQEKIDSQKKFELEKSVGNKRKNRAFDPASSPLLRG